MSYGNENFYSLIGDIFPWKKHEKKNERRTERRPKKETGGQKEVVNFCRRRVSRK